LHFYSPQNEQICATQIIRATATGRGKYVGHIYRTLPTQIYYSLRFCSLKLFSAHNMNKTTSFINVLVSKNLETVYKYSNTPLL